MIFDSKHLERLKNWNEPSPANLTSAALFDKPVIQREILAPTEPASPRNTAFLSVSAYGNDSYKRSNVFMRSAARFGITLRWLSLREQWRGFTYHKLQQFLRLAPYLQEQGFQYAFMLDAFDCCFTDGPSVICQKANEVYEQGTILFNRELDNWTYPYKNEYFKTELFRVGVPLNAGLLFGSLKAIKDGSEAALRIQHEIMANKTRPGMLRHCMADPAFTNSLGHWINDDQLLFLLAGFYHKELYRTDDERRLLSWCQQMRLPLAEERAFGNKSGKPHQGSIIHSSVTVNLMGVEHWEKWCRENDLIL